MKKECEVCGALSGRGLEVVIDGQSHPFDCFECAAHALAPACELCGCTILGHGIEADGFIFCCTHCEKGYGRKGLIDRTDEPKRKMA
jgi:hypothetical protein